MQASGPIIVIGTSAGGVDALKKLAASLPDGFPAPIFIVMHVGEVSYMPEILARAGPLPVVRPESGARIEPGSIHVAPPGRHMLVHDDAESTIERLLRVHQQRAAMAHRVAARDLAEGRHESAKRMKQSACDYDWDAESIKKLLLDCDNGSRHAPEQL
jgi:chemotaxis response regulator CheB